jgi:hypothetical protein
VSFSYKGGPGGLKNNPSVIFTAAASYRADTPVALIYDANDATSGSAPTDGTTYYNGSTVTVLGNTGDLAKTDYVFVGWNTEADGSGTTYQPDATFTMGNVSRYCFLGTV